MLHARIVSCSNAACTCSLQVFFERRSNLTNAICLKCALLFTNLLSGSFYPKALDIWHFGNNIDAYVIYGNNDGCIIW